METDGVADQLSLLGVFGPVTDTYGDQSTTQGSADSAVEPVDNTDGPYTAPCSWISGALCPHKVYSMSETAALQAQVPREEQVRAAIMNVEKMRLKLGQAEYRRRMDLLVPPPSWRRPLDKQAKRYDRVMTADQRARKLEKQREYKKNYKKPTVEERCGRCATCTAARAIRRSCLTPNTVVR